MGEGPCPTLNLVLLLHTNALSPRGASFIPGQFTLDKGTNPGSHSSLQMGIRTSDFLLISQNRQEAAGATPCRIVRQITVMIDGLCDSQLSQRMEGAQRGGLHSRLPSRLSWTKSNKTNGHEAKNTTEEIFSAFVLSLLLNHSRSFSHHGPP